MSLRFIARRNSIVLSGGSKIGLVGNVADLRVNGVRLGRWHLVGTACLRPYSIVGTEPGRILVIDDDVEVQLVVKRAAEAHGFEVVQALDGAPGLALATAQTFDLIVLDVNMPDMDGRDVLSCLKRDPATAAVPVLVYSGRDTSDHARREGLELGAEDYVEKPLDVRSLVLKIGYLIQKARASKTQPTL